MTGRIFISLSVLLLILSGCGSPSHTTVDSGGQPTISISPTSTAVGSATTELTVIGHNFAGDGVCGSCTNSVVVWTTNSSGHRLATTFVSSTQLKTEVPANLLTTAGTAKVTVETWAAGAESPLSVTEPAAFSVKELAADAPTISGISPLSTPAASADLTITITGSKFEKYKTVAFWTTDPSNLHDHGSMLNTQFVSSTEISAVIPAALLESPITVRIVVLTGDPMGMSDGYFGYPESNSVAFTVTP